MIFLMLGELDLLSKVVVVCGLSSCDTAHEERQLQDTAYVLRHQRIKRVLVTMKIELAHGCSSWRRDMVLRYRSAHMKCLKKATPIMAATD